MYDLANQKNDLFSNLTIICISGKWTGEMEYNLNKSSRLQIRFVWVSLRNQFFDDPKYRHNHLFKKYVRHIESKYEYGEQFNKPLLLEIAKSFQDIGNSGWFIYLDNDEILGYKDWLTLNNLVKYLNKTKVYAIPRLWVIKRKSIFRRIRSARTSRSIFDWQYRLFNIQGIEPLAFLHQPLIFNKSTRLRLGIRIIHFGHQDSLEARREKLYLYEKVSGRSMRSKYRYYLPEDKVSISFLKFNNFGKLNIFNKCTIRDYAKSQDKVCKKD